METAVGDDEVGRFFLHQPCYHFRCQTSSVNGTPHMSVSVADLLWAGQRLSHVKSEARSDSDLLAFDLWHSALSCMCVRIFYVYTYARVVNAYS